MRIFTNVCVFFPGFNKNLNEFTFQKEKIGIINEKVQKFEEKCLLAAAQVVKDFISQLADFDTMLIEQLLVKFIVNAIAA